MDDFGLQVGRYLATLPTLTDTETNELQLDESGRLIIAGRWLAGTDSWATGQSVVGAGAVRNDAGGPLAGVADLEWTPLQTDANGALRVNATVNIDSQSDKNEDTAHSDGDVGEYILSVRLSDINGANGPLLAGTNGDYQSFFTNDKGELYVKDTDVLSKLIDIETTINDGIDVTVAPTGTEAYTVTDALAAAGDGLETITAAATPWITVATLAVGAGTTAYVYGWQWACDQNAQARLVTDDTVNTVIYKTTVNSTAQPGKEEHWDADGRIEVAGAANLEIQVQIKKRTTAGGNANGTGSIHVRTV